MTCKKCNTKIEAYEISECCSICGKEFHDRCLQKKYVETSKLVEFLTGKSHTVFYLCDRCS